jgi:GNAT superfamily N-acetyltransferase
MLPEARGLSELSAPERQAAARALGDTPFTAQVGGQLEQGFCRAYAVGDSAAARTLVVHQMAAPTELIAYGTDLPGLWSVLSRVPGWDCVNVDAGFEGEAASFLERKIGAPSKILSVRFYSLEHDPIRPGEVGARRLGLGDLDRVGRADPVFRTFFLGHGDAARTLVDGVVAGVTIEDRLVSAVTTSAWAGRHVDLGAVTAPDQRGRGLATAAASIVCAELRARGRVPVWGAGEPNAPSWRIAEKLGFRFVGRRDFVVFESLRPRGFQPA